MSIRSIFLSILSKHKLIQFQGRASGARQSGVVPVINLDKKVDLEAKLKERQALIKPGHSCAVIYTSGTTGNPKGVLLSHDNLCFQVHAIMSLTKWHLNEDEERILSYLPLSHVAGFLAEPMAQMAHCGLPQSKGSSCMFFCRPYDLREGTLKNRLTTSRPTWFFGVPRVYEKLADTLQTIGAKNTGLKKRIGDFSKRKGVEFAREAQVGKTGVKPGMYGPAQGVHNKIHAQLGLDKCKFLGTGAAPIQQTTVEYFGSIGMWINELYGMSECCGATTFSTDAAHKWGSVGFSLPGCEVAVFEIDPVSD